MTTTLAGAVAGAGSAYYQLFLLVHPLSSTPNQVLTRHGETEGWTVVNVGLELARRLVDEMPARQSHIAPQILRQLIAAAAGDVVVLVNIPVLFSASLRLQPLELLKSLSRVRTLVVAWPGAVEGASITYAEPGWPEYRILDTTGVSVLPIESIAGL